MKKLFPNISFFFSQNQQHLDKSQFLERSSLDEPGRVTLRSIAEGFNWELDCNRCSTHGLDVGTRVHAQTIRVGFRVQRWLEEHLGEHNGPQKRKLRYSIQEFDIKKATTQVILELRYPMIVLP